MLIAHDHLFRALMPPISTLGPLDNIIVAKILYHAEVRAIRVRDAKPNQYVSGFASRHETSRAFWVTQRYKAGLPRNPLTWGGHAAVLRVIHEARFNALAAQQCPPFANDALYSHYIFTFDNKQG